MGKLNPDFSFTGRLGNVVAYKRMGSKQVNLRTVSGSNRDKIHTAACYEGTRKVNKEWKGAVKASSALWEALGLKHVEDPNFTGHCNGLCKSIQRAIEPGVCNDRPVLFSQFPFLLEGLNVNADLFLDQVIRYQPECSLDKDSLSASIRISELVPALNFKQYGKLPLYRISAQLNLIADYYYEESLHDYRPLDPCAAKKDSYLSDWLSVHASRPEGTIQLQMEAVRGYIPGNHATLLLTMAVEFGTLLWDGKPGFVKYNGCGKVLKVG